MNREERAEIRARLAAATPGPWRVSPSPSGTRWIDAGTYDEVISPASVDCMRYCYGGTSDINLSVADADLIAHAPDDLRRLLDALDEAEREVLRLTPECVCGPWHPSTDGPLEDCPTHGRPYAEWVERGNVLQARLNTLTAALRDPDEATVEAVAEAIAEAALLVEGYVALPGHALAWQDEARAAIAALADHLLGGES